MAVTVTKDKVGECVWLLQPEETRGVYPKLKQAWDGLQKMVKKINDTLYIIRKPAGKTKEISRNHGLRDVGYPHA